MPLAPLRAQENHYWNDARYNCVKGQPCTGTEDRWSVVSRTEAAPAVQDGELLKEIVTLLSSMGLRDYLKADMPYDLCKLASDIGSDDTAALNPDWLNCNATTEQDLARGRQSLQGLLGTVIQPLINATARDAYRATNITTSVTYVCDEWRGDASNRTSIEYRYCSSDSSSSKCGHSGLPPETEPGSHVWIKVTIRHACACQGASEQCRIDYTSLRDNVGRADRCDKWRDERLVVLGMAALAVTLLVWLSERWELRLIRPSFSLPSSPTSALKDTFCCFSLVPPINFMENRKGSLVVATMFGCLASLIFRQIVAPTQKSLLESFGWLALMYPVFICQACSARLLGAALGATYCAMLAVFLWHDVECNIRADRGNMGALMVVPGVCFSVFVFWYCMRIHSVLRGNRGDTWNIWGDYDHRSMVSALFLPPEDFRPERPPRRWWMRLFRLATKDMSASFLHFRYSPRMFAMVIMCICMLIQFQIFLLSRVEALGSWIERELSGGLCCHGLDCHNEQADRRLWIRWTENSTTPLLDTLRGNIKMTYSDCEETKVLINGMEKTVAIASILVLLINVYSLCHMVVVYRKHMLRFYRGDKKFLADSTPGPLVALTDCLKYAAYQVIFVIAGWMFGTALLVILLGFVAVTLILPHFMHKDLPTAGFWPWVLHQAFYNPEEGELGPLALAICLSVFLAVSVKFFFLDVNVPLAVRNREFWDVFDLFQTSTNYVLGLFMFIRRFVFMLIFGFLFISRLDKSLLPRGYEHLDPAFSTYQGFLTVELYYSNPVMLTFIQLLLEAHSTKQQLELMTNMFGVSDADDDALLPLEDGLGPQKKTKRRSPSRSRSPIIDRSPSRMSRTDDPHLDRRTSAIALRQATVSFAVKRWQLLYTLLKNPQLRVQRGHHGTYDAKKDRFVLRKRGKSMAPEPKIRGPDDLKMFVPDDYDEDGRRSISPTRRSSSAVLNVAYLGDSQTPLPATAS